MNPHMMPMLEAALRRGFRVLVLTNAMRPLMKLTRGLLDLNERFGQKLVLRISLDHYTEKLHEMERGPIVGDTLSRVFSGCLTMAST